jgi:hypothetical protein
MEAEERQQIVDQEHLKLLVIGYKISAGIAGLYSFFGLFYVFMGFVFAFMPSSSSFGTSGVPQTFFGWYFGGIGVVFLAVGLTVASLRWMAARRLEQRRSLGFCQVVAALSCLEIPYGTMLGVLTFVTLARQSVRSQFS